MDGCYLRPCEAQEAVVPAVLEEARAQRLRELDGLAGDRHARHGDGVRVDVAGGARAVAVADVPGPARLLGRARVLRVVDRVAAVLARVRELGAGGDAPSVQGLVRLVGTCLQIQRSDEPVSKSRCRVTPGVPILTATTYCRLDPNQLASLIAYMK